MTPPQSIAAISDDEISALLTCLGDAMREASSVGPRARPRNGEHLPKSARTERQSLLRREVTMLRGAVERLAIALSRHGQNGSRGDGPGGQLNAPRIEQACPDEVAAAFAAADTQQMCVGVEEREKR